MSEDSYRHLHRPRACPAKGGVYYPVTDPANGGAIGGAGSGAKLGISPPPVFKSLDPACAGRGDLPDGEPDLGVGASLPLYSLLFLSSWLIADR